jgi:membrane glycosyltransferase
MNPELRRGCGGVSGLLKSFVAETILSMLLSPIMMLIQTGFVFDILMGRDSGWNAQNRNEGAVSFSTALNMHFFHVIAGLVFATVAAFISTAALMWMLPIVAGLVLSPWVSSVTSRADVGLWLWKMNVFRIPEEPQPQGRAELLRASGAVATAVASAKWPS